MTGILDASRRTPAGASFTLSHRLTRLLWNLVWLAGASWTPPMLRPWRVFLLRAFGARVAPTAIVYGSARIWHPANLEMGDHACIGPRVIVYSMADIRFGAHALASQGAHICAGTHDIDDPNFQLEARPIEIGEGAWVAAEAFVGPGVSIGDWAVLGARAVAFRDLEAWGVYAGNPAKRIRTRERLDRAAVP